MNLPVTDVLPELIAALQTRGSAVLQAPPGAGKSTVVPLALLEAGCVRDHRIIMLEPRRLAARAVATRMAQQLGEPPGVTVGYRTRFETRVSARTRIEVVTEGILTRMLQSDAALEGVSLVIFDEFHERSLQADLGLALSLDVQSALREDLQLLVMSATLAAEPVAKLLSDAPIITSHGRMHPVEVVYAGAASRDLRDLPGSLVRVIRSAIDQHEGDVLVFLPGQGEIRRTQSLLENVLPAGIHVRPLYGELDMHAQDLAVRPSAAGERKIVLATNIAETSLTIEGVRIVVDSGLERRARFDPASAMNTLETLRISRASADQRAGRAGRTAPGVCYRLWSQTEQVSLRAHTPPEISDVDLAPLALELSIWGIRDVQQLRWLDEPPAAAFNQARDVLRALQAIDAEGRPTAHGRRMAQAGLHPRLAHMVIKAAEGGAGEMACRVAALLEERDILRNTTDVDLRTRLDALRARGAVAADVDEAARQRVLRSAAQVATRLNITGSTGEDAEPGALIAWAYPDRIAQARGDRGRFLLANGRGAYIADAQLVSQARYLAVATLDMRDREARVRLAAPIAESTLETQFVDRIEERTRIEWSSRERAVIARRERWLDALLLSERRIERPDPDQLLAAMLLGIRETGIDVLPWTDEAQRLRARLQFMHRHDPQGGWPDVSNERLLESLEDWLAPWLDDVTRLDHLARLDMSQSLRALLSYDQQRQLEEFAPTHLAVPSGSRIPIDYGNAPPLVGVRLQEVFGLQATPRVARGRVPLTMQLLSPAHRPVQVTQDLASFWKNGYPDVKKEMKGRYPRHYWPEDPLTATATARAKPRGQ